MILIEILENKLELESFQRKERIQEDPEKEKYLEHLTEEKIDKAELHLV